MCENVAAQLFWQVKSADRHGRSQPNHTLGVDVPHHILDSCTVMMYGFKELPQQLPLLCQDQLFPIVEKQLCAVVLFQGFNVLRNGRLCDVQFICRLGIAHIAADRQKSFDAKVQHTPFPFLSTILLFIAQCFAEPAA